MSAATPRITGKPVSPRVRRILAELCETSGIPGCRVSSTQRSPREQAEAMYGLIVRQSEQAVRRLYKQPGKSVVDVAATLWGQSRAAVVAAMEAKILELGPERVSKHCSLTHEVIDVAPSSIPEARLAAFIDAATCHPEIDRVLSPLGTPPDPEAVHLEIEKETLT